MTRIVTVAQTGSTNADLLALARTGAGEGLWLRAEHQSAGRGRQNRAWQTPPGNFAASTIVRLRQTDPPAATLALVAAVALEEVVRAALPDAGGLQLKWPNDLLLDGAKLSGILLERTDDAVVIGIGVNLAHRPDISDRATTALGEHNAIVDPAGFMTELAAMFGAWLHHWRHEGMVPVIARWTERAHREGTPLAIRLPDGTAIKGQFARLASDGALVLRLADGRERVIHAADVFLV